MKRTGIISVLLVVILLISTSCASGVSQEEYDGVKKEISAIQSELASLQSELTDKLAEYMVIQLMKWLKPF
jgi:peptidoglycan hydrolase CwlO-like protein